MTDYVAVKTLAAEVGLDRSQVLKVLKRMGIVPTLLATSGGARGQRCSYVTASEADRFRRARSQGRALGEARDRPGAAETMP